MFYQPITSMLVGCSPCLVNLQTSITRLDSNGQPWSEYNCSGGENQRKTSSTNLSATVEASCLDTGRASIQKEK